MVLGNLDITRDWGWAPEYVEAMWLMLQAPCADDYVIATGASYSLEQFVEKAFELYELDWRKHVQVDASFFRPLDIHISKGNPIKAKEKLGWQARANLDQVISRMASGHL
jgi:GDPmannose 4,6-dehydratase